MSLILLLKVKICLTPVLRWKGVDILKTKAQHEGGNVIYENIKIKTNVQLNCYSSSHTNLSSDSNLETWILHHFEIYSRKKRYIWKEAIYIAVGKFQYYIIKIVCY